MAHRLAAHRRNTDVIPTRYRQRFFEPSRASDHLLRLGRAGLLFDLLEVGRPEILTDIRRAFPDPSRVAGAHALKERTHLSHAVLVAHGGIDHLGQTARPGGAHQWSRRHEIREIKAWNTFLFCLLHN